MEKGYEESVILCRDREERIHVFLNTCQHRGMKVCRYDEGNTPIFTCPHHGWSCATDGQLVGEPFFIEAYHGKLDKSRYRLVEVAQLCNYKGTIWATWEAAAPAFLEYLAEGGEAEFPSFPIGKVTRKGMTLKSARGHSYRAVELALKQLASHRFPLELMTTHTFGLKDLDYAIKSVGGEGAPGAIHVSVLPWQ